MTTLKRRPMDTLRDVDGLLEAHLRDARMAGAPLANLAAAMAIEYSGADRGALLIDGAEGLEAVIALESDLSRSGERAAGYDLELIATARAGLRTAARPGRIAAPVLLDQRVASILYLEGEPDNLGEDAVELADGVARRIAALLRSAALVEELARRTQNVSTLEALGACFAAGELRQEHLDRAIDGALGATRSDAAMLTLFEAPAGTPRSTVRGGGAAELQAMEERWSEAIARGPATDLGASVEGPCIVEPFWADLLPTAGARRRAVGFLALRRREGRPAYEDADRTFCRAVAHLISGGLARMEYFTRAAEDPLTETGSRLALQLGLAEAESNARETGRAFSLLLLDVDRFKEINDRWGHIAGDEVLRGLATVLRSRLRGTDSVARYGGDEFVLILPQTDAEQAASLGEELRALIGRQTFTDRRIEITVSIGVATSSDETAQLQRVLDAADRALYRSKSRGRNRLTHVDEPAGDG